MANPIGLVAVAMTLNTAPDSFDSSVPYEGVVCEPEDEECPDDVNEPADEPGTEEAPGEGEGEPSPEPSVF